MTSYLISYSGFFQDLKVRTYPTKAAAQAVYDDPADSPDRSGLVVGEEADLDLGGGGLVGLYNAVTGEAVSKFESRRVGQRRTWDALVQTYQHQPHEQGSAAPAGGTTEVADNLPEGDVEMASKKKTKKAAKKAAKKTGEPRAPRGVGKPAGKVADLRPIRENTDRARVLKLMTGRSTAAQIGQELGIDEKKVGTIIFCMSRDCGIGYSFGDKGQVAAVYPGDKGYKDVIKKAAE